MINTGSESATFQLKADLVEGPVLAQREPEKVYHWFSFHPQSFGLAPDATQLVKMTLMLPFSAPAGEYEVFLEASPQGSAQNGAWRLARPLRLSFILPSAAAACCLPSKTASPPGFISTHLSNCS